MYDRKNKRRGNGILFGVLCEDCFRVSAGTGAFFSSSSVCFANIGFFNQNQIFAGVLGA